MKRGSIKTDNNRWVIQIAAWVIFTFGATISPISGQEIRRDGTPIRASYVGATAAGTLILFLLDEPVRGLLQANRSEFGDDVAHGLRQLGEIGVVYPASFGVLGVGLLASNTELKRGGAQMALSLTVAAGITVAGKFIFGRARPPAEQGAWSFDPFTSVFAKSLPSGHTAIAFAFATTLADFTDATLARVLIYATAAGTGWSRMNDDRHWFGDVGLGAVVGMASSKLVTGRWTLFGIKTPRYLADPGAERVNFGELALGAAAGVAVFHAVTVLSSSAHNTSPFVAPLRSGVWGVGVQLGF